MELYCEDLARRCAEVGSGEGRGDEAKFSHTAPGAYGWMDAGRNWLGAGKVVKGRELGIGIRDQEKDIPAVGGVFYEA